MNPINEIVYISSIFFLGIITGAIIVGSIYSMLYAKMQNQNVELKRRLIRSRATVAEILKVQSQKEIINLKEAS
jgi:uncharacterized membrane protein YciS (DUF1049 family)